MKAMKRAAETDERIAARVKFFLYRVPEEFYDYEKDPCALNNLIDDPEYRDRIVAFRARLLKMMESTSDPLLDTYKKHLLSH